MILSDGYKMLIITTCFIKRFVDIKEEDLHIVLWFGLKLVNFFDAVLITFFVVMNLQCYTVLAK